MLCRLWLVSCLTAARESLPKDSESSPHAHGRPGHVARLIFLPFLLSIHPRSETGFINVTPMAGSLGRPLITNNNQSYWKRFEWQLAHSWGRRPALLLEKLTIKLQRPTLAGLSREVLSDTLFLQDRLRFRPNLICTTHTGNDGVNL